jgi:hypothetical protein
MRKDGSLWTDYIHAGAGLLRHPEEIRAFVKDYVERGYFTRYWSSSNVLTNAKASRLAVAELRGIDPFQVGRTFYWYKAIAEFAPRGA